MAILFFVLIAFNLLLGGFLIGMKFAKLFPRQACMVEAWFQNMIDGKE